MPILFLQPGAVTPGGKPQDELAAMEKVMPGWCQFLTACRSGRYVLISREEAISNSFASLGLIAAQIQSQIAGRLSTGG